MATINRFNKFTPRDYSMKWYVPEFFVPNFEQWNSVLAGYQNKYDAALAATQKYPKHLENRIDLAGQYRTNTENSVNDITNTYINNGVTAGNRKMRDFALQLNKDWQPGGLAYELEQEFTDYQTAAQNIDKYYKDNKAENSANRLYSLDKLQKASQGEFKKDPVSGMYQRANISASLYPYVDIAEEAQKIVKDIKENGSTDIIKMSPAWFKKIQTEEVTPERIKEVTDALLQQPKYQEQRDIELWREKSKYTPEQLTAIEEATKQSYRDNFNKQTRAIDSMKKDKTNVTQIQQTLKNEGYYDGKINGSYDVATKEAYEKYKQDNAAKLEETISKTNIDSILSKQILDNYSKPLITAYARKKEEESLIFNQEWEVNRKIAAQRESTTSLVSAIQSLKAPEQSQFLTTPGLSRPMDTLDNLKKEYQKTYDDSKKTFSNIAEISGITKIIGSSAPNQIHAITEARLKSATPEEFATNLQNAGISANPDKLWNYFNSPGAEKLKNSYISMQQSKEDLNGSSEAEVDVIGNYFKTDNGKKQLGQLQKQYPFLKNQSEKEIAKLIANNDPRLSYETPVNVSSGGFGQTSLKDLKKNNIAQSIKTSINESKDPTLFPDSLRGFAFTSTKGPGLDMKKTIIEDFKSGYTLGYTSGGIEGVQFKTISQNGKSSPVELNDINLDQADLRFNVDAKGVTYYMTSKTLGKDSKPVVMVAEAPKEHYGKLKQLSLEMLRQAENTNDQSQKDLALKMYSTVTKGPQLRNAVEDALDLNDKNSRKLYDVIDPNVKDRVQYFSNNENVIGAPIGTEVEANGLVYQKFKVKNPKTGDKAYIMGVKTNAGYMPIKNESGGFYYNSSSAADNILTRMQMLKEIPVEINNSKIYNPNLSEAETTSLLLSAEQIVNNNDD